uniref:Naja naja atra deletetion of cardiotoxin 5 n=1 Tax=Naja atra TaxID=8656 RepID=O93443_NAJAT|nr:unnamed protein product [Naja atra]
MKTLLLTLVVVTIVCLDLEFPVKRGCADNCPKNSALLKYVCCSTDKCN